MNHELAKCFLESLIERIVSNPETGQKSLPGNLSKHEIDSLNFALQLLGGAPPEALDDKLTEVDNADKEEQDVAEELTIAKPVDVQVTLNLKSLDMESPEDNNILMCLDFGTAMSKAFAVRYEEDYVLENLPLQLGKRALQGSQNIYPVPSSIWIDDDGYFFFGERAVALSLQDDSGKRQRLDSLKRELIQGLVAGDPMKASLPEEVNPSGVAVSRGEAIVIYLSFLTDLACSELTEIHQRSRYVRRRYALPSWDQSRRKWGEEILKEMLSKAQIFADTFHGRWDEGIHVSEIKEAFKKINELENLPTYLIGEGITEPLAAGTSRVRQDERSNGLVLVADIGAGTSDFALFMVKEEPDRELFGAWAIEGCNQTLHQAGDLLDKVLHQAVMKKANIDTGDESYPAVSKNLTMEIRKHKETLFQDDICSVTLNNGERVTIRLEDFLNSPEVARFSELLKNKCDEVLSLVPEDISKRYAGQKITFVLTGGGATLPMVETLADGEAMVGATKLLKIRADLIPDDVYGNKELTYVYPQMAVAIGGAHPNPIDERKAISKFPGLDRQGWVLDRVQMQGL
jgi:molecular chaperone HscA